METEQQGMDQLDFSALDADDDDAPAPDPRHAGPQQQCSSTPSLGPCRRHLPLVRRAKHGVGDVTPSTALGTSSKQALTDA
jgi:hypothetical protein